MEINKVIQQSQFKDNFFKAYINLIYTSNYFRDAFNSVFKKFGISSQHYNVLRIIRGKYPNPLTPGKIKEVMLDKGTDLTRILDKLESLEWIARRVCPENRRMLHVSVTEKGLEIIENIDLQITELANSLKSLEEHEYNQISDWLDKMRG